MYYSDFVTSKISLTYSIFIELNIFLSFAIKFVFLEKYSMLNNGKHLHSKSVTSNITFPVFRFHNMEVVLL